MVSSRLEDVNVRSRALRGPFCVEVSRPQEPNQPSKYSSGPWLWWRLVKRVEVHELHLCLKWKQDWRDPLLGSLSNAGNWTAKPSDVDSVCATASVSFLLPQRYLYILCHSPSEVKCKTHQPLSRSRRCERFLKRTEISTTGAVYSPIWTHACAFVKNSPKQSSYVMETIKMDSTPTILGLLD